MKMRKQIIAGLLGVALILSLSVPAAAAEEKGASAQLGRVAVIVDGRTGHNYLVDEASICQAITYSGMQYVPLMTAGLWLGADAAWDKSAQTVDLQSNGKEPVLYSHSDLYKMGVQPLGGEQNSIDLDKGITVEPLTDLTVTVDGETQRLASALIFRDHLFVPLDWLAARMGKTALSFGGDVFLYDPPAAETVAGAGAYFTAVRDKLAAARAIATGEPPRTEAEYSSKVKEIQTRLIEIWELPQPEFSPLNESRFLPDITFWTLFTLRTSVDPYLPEGEGSGAAAAQGSEPTPLPVIQDMTFDEKWEHFTSYLITVQPDSSTYFMQIQKTCAACQRFMTAVAAGTSPAKFTDAADITHPEAVAALTRLGVISGRDDGSFAPGGNVTRAEAAKMICLILRGGKEPEEAQGPGSAFSDVKGHWAEAHIAFCTELGVINGRGDGAFDPDGEVTVLELVKMSLAALGYDPAAYRLTGSSWAARTDELARSTDPALYDGLAGVKASAPASRDTAAQMLYNALRVSPMVVVPASPDAWRFEKAANADGTPISLLQARFGLDTFPAP